MTYPVPLASTYPSYLESPKAFWFGNLIKRDFSLDPKLEELHTQAIVTAQKTFFDLCSLRSFNQRLSSDSPAVNFRLFDAKIYRFSTKKGIERFLKKSSIKKIVRFIESLQQSLEDLKFSFRKWQQMATSAMLFPADIVSQYKTRFLETHYLQTITLYYQKHFSVVFLESLSQDEQLIHISPNKHFCEIEQHSNECFDLLKFF
jgi:hypothetical protein